MSIRALIAAAWLATASSAALAQSTLDHPTGRDIPVDFDSGALGNNGKEFVLVASVPVEVRSASWQRVYFSQVNLEGTSFVRAISMRDGETQDLDADAIRMWNNTTAYFNGDVVLLELWAAPGTQNNRFAIEKVAVMDGPDISTLGDPGQCGICGTDNRVASNVDWSARVMPVGCTATVYCRAGYMLSAGHCVGANQVMQFRVPGSNANCSTNAPPVAEQFPVISTSSNNGGVGADWAVYRVGTNNLGQTPYHRYGVNVNLGGVVNSGSSFIRGFGVDTNCVLSQTQQLSNGSIVGTTGTTLEFNNDIRGGNSGSGFFGPSATMIGVVTHCRVSTCASVGTSNIATRIDLGAFVTARNNFAGICNSTLRLIDVQATGTGGTAAPITVSAADADGLQNGSTNFKRVYANGTSVTFTAPSVVGSACFTRWVLNGSPQGANPLSVSMTGDFTLVAEYGTCSAPSNNACGSALFLNEGTANGTNVAATNDGVSNCGTFGPPPLDVWYWFRAGCSGTVRLETLAGGTLADTVLSVHSACPGTVANTLACNDDTGGLLSRIDLPVTEGTVYYVRVHGYNGTSGTFVLSRTQALGTPINDACTSALAVGLGTFNGSVCGATNDGQTTCGFGTTNKDVYYAFTAPCTGNYIVDTEGTAFLDTVLSIHSACPATAANTIACDDDSGTGLRSYIQFAAVAGTTYRIRVTGYNGTTGSFQLNISDPDLVNDTCANATGVVDGSYFWDNCGANTDGPADTTACTFFGSAQVNGDLWYRYTARCNGTATVTTCGLTSHDTKLHAYAACPTGPNQQIACSDDNCALQTTITFPVAAGGQYLVRLGSFSATGRGSGQVQFTCTALECPPCPADFNDSGGTPDDADVTAFFEAWNAGEPCADVNDSGGTPDDADVTIFFELWNAGGC